MSQGAQQLKPGDVFAERYQIAEVLGGGVYGGSFRALDRKTTTTVLLKIFTVSENVDLVRYAKHLEQLVDTFRGWTDLDDLIIPYEYGDWEDTTYFISPYVGEAETLAQLLVGHGAMPPALVLDIISELIQTQRKLHQKGFVHADIKPSNIVVKIQNIRKVYLIDFGMAEIDESQNQLILAGTNRYLHPIVRYGTLPPRSDAVEEETLLRKVNEPDKSSVRRRESTFDALPRPGSYLDLYATGIVAFDMLTGGARPPFPLRREDFLSIVCQGNSWLRNAPPEDILRLHAVVARLVAVRPNEAHELETVEIPRLILRAYARFPGDQSEVLDYLSRRVVDVTNDQTATTRTIVIGRLTKISDELDVATQVVRSPITPVQEESKIETQSDRESIVFPKTAASVAVVNGVQSSVSQSDNAIIEISQVFRDAGRRERHTWKLSIVMIIAAFAIVVLMVSLSAIFSLITGKAVWAVVCGSVGAGTLLTTMLWRPFDRLMRANILLQQLSVLQIQAAVAYRESSTAQEKIKLLTDVSKRLDAVFAYHANPEPRAANR